MVFLTVAVTHFFNPWRGLRLPAPPKDQRMQTTTHRPARRQCQENLVDSARVIEIATRYPSIEVDALAERFGVSSRTIYNELKAAGISREDEPATTISAPLHPWRPTPRRKPAQTAMSKAERQRLIDDFLAKHSVTRIPPGVMATSDVIFADTIHE
jgi:hypothetical protein